MAAISQSAEEQALVQEVLSSLNLKSIAQNREFCGYIGFDTAGKLRASNATPGDEASCLPDEPTKIDLITSSYHTHGAFSTEYFNEIPSGDDMESDEAEGIDGWVATPGGRLWYIDTEDMVTWQVCGIGCLPSDPEFIKGDMGPIDQSYHYDDLIEIIGN